MRRHETPLRRRNPSGEVRWVARWTDRNGRRQSAGTFELKREAQAAIDDAYDRELDGRAPRQVGTVEAYLPHWQRVHPRSSSTERAYRDSIKIAMDVKVGGRPLRLWRLDEVERSEIAELLHHLLTVDGRAVNGCRRVLSALSAMWEDAISDGWARHNPVRGVRIRHSDPRVRKPRREPRVYSWEQMHAMAAKAPPQVEAMIRVLSDCGLRLGEMLALERADVDGEWLTVRRTAQDGVVTAGTKTTRDCPEKARRVPLPPGLAGLLRALPARLDTRLLFPGSRGGRVMQQREFYRMWGAAREAAGLPDARPHDFRHSYVSLMRAAGVDPAHLAAWTGHSVLTATVTYTHAVGDVSDIARRAVSA